MAGDKPRVLEARRAASSDGVVISMPRRPRRISDIVPGLVTLSALGTQVRDRELWKEMTTKLEGKMKAFRSACAPELDKAIRLHAARFLEGHYDNPSADVQNECDRLTRVLVYGQYLETCLEKLHESAMLLGHTGLLTLAELAVKDVVSALSADFYGLAPAEADNRVRSVLPQLQAALKEAGLSDYAELNERNVASVQKRVAGRLEAAMDEMDVAEAATV